MGRRRYGFPFQFVRAHAYGKYMPERLKSPKVWRHMLEMPEWSISILSRFRTHKKAKRTLALLGEDNIMQISPDMLKGTAKYQCEPQERSNTRALLPVPKESDHLPLWNFLIVL